MRRRIRLAVSFNVDVPSGYRFGPSGIVSVREWIKPMMENIVVPLESDQDIHTVIPTKVSVEQQE